MPSTVSHTRRQRVTTQTGVQLERQAIYLPSEAWHALQRLSLASRRSGSQVIEQLIQIADRGNPIKEIPNERSSTAEQRRD